MASRYAPRHFRAASRRTAHSFQVRKHHTGLSAFAVMAALIGVPLAIGTVVITVIGIVALAGGLDPPYHELKYPRPEGYRFEGWTLDRSRTLCVDPRGGPPVNWSLLNMVEDAVATWRAAAPSLPLSVSGVCESAGGTAHEDGRVRWNPLKNLWGIAYSPDADIDLDPGIAPSSWDCVRAVLLHELGHIIGLDHQPDDVPSIMNPSGCQHSIALVDVAAVQYLYEGRAR